MARTNLLIADDVGLGKTIEAGLVIQEMLLRHRARTILVLCPSSLQETWRTEMAESVIGLYKTEVIYRRGPWRGFEDVEYATLEWVAWFNTQRLLEPLGYVPPAEFEEQYCRIQATQSECLAVN